MILDYLETLKANIKATEMAIERLERRIETLEHASESENGIDYGHDTVVSIKR